MIDVLTERQFEAIELILEAAAKSPTMADDATREAMEFARPLLETAPALGAFVAQLARQLERTGQAKTPQGRALARSAGELVQHARPD